MPDAPDDLRDTINRLIAADEDTEQLKADLRSYEVEVSQATGYDFATVEAWLSPAPTKRQANQNGI